MLSVLPSVSPTLSSIPELSTSHILLPISESNEPSILESSKPFIKPRDLDIPIALRKGVHSYTKHLIAKYLLYYKISHNHRAFTQKISHFFVPRNIQEALDDPNWKLAVMEEMNSLRRSGTLEIVDLPKENKMVGCKWVFTVNVKLIWAWRGIMQDL